MQKYFVALLVALVPLNRSVAVESSPPEVVQIDHGKMDAAFAKGMPLVANGNYKLRAGRRVGPGTVEVHPRDTDIFYVTEGEATIVTGGAVVNAKTSATGEVSAEKITGGVTRRLAKGDVLVVPAGVPHWFTAIDGAFLYFLVKVSN